MPDNHINYNDFLARMFVLAYLRGGTKNFQELGVCAKRLDYNNYLKDTWIYKALAELDEEGLIVKTKSKTPDGITTYIYSITDKGIGNSKKLTNVFNGLLDFLDGAYEDFLED